MIDQKVQGCFSNFSARKYPSKMVLYSKRTFGCQVSNETDTNHGSFLFFEKLNRNHGAIFSSVFKRLHHGFCLISPEIRSLHDWGLSHLRPDIQLSVLSTKPFLRIFAC